MSKEVSIPRNIWHKIHRPCRNHQLLPSVSIPRIVSELETSLSISDMDFVDIADGCLDESDVVLEAVPNLLSGQ